jgi:hypothetical protein
LQSLIEEFAPDVVHANDVTQPHLLEIVAAWNRGVVTVQDHRFFCPGQGKVDLDDVACREPMGETCQALACGVTVVASNVGGLTGPGAQGRDPLRHGRTTGREDEGILADRLRETAARECRGRCPALRPEASSDSTQGDRRARSSTTPR